MAWVSRNDQDSDDQSTARSEADELSGARMHQQAWETFAASAIRLIPVLKAHMTAVTEETERGVEELSVHLRMLASSVAGTPAKNTSTSVSKIVMAMQFQDITCQKLEHVGHVLDQWSRHLEALLRGPQDEGARQEIAALEKIEQTYTMDAERRLHQATVKPDYQEPVPMESMNKEGDPVTLF